MFYTRFVAGLLVLLAGAARSHELWIEPRDFQVEAGETLEADLRNGEEFRGVSLAFFDNRSTRFELVLGEQTHPVTGRMGDTPAIAMPVEGEGLLVILHESTPSRLTYQKWDKFLAFAEHKDFPEAAVVHEAEGWPREGFRERYTRHAKALVAVGSGAGEDRAFGMDTEFVARTNPYEADFAGTMVVDLFYRGQPRADAQVEVFDRAADGTVSVSLYRTDAAGRAAVPVTPGHDYLFDAVVLRKAPPAPDTPGAPVWETLWAALTFHVPTNG